MFASLACGTNYAQTMRMNGAAKWVGGSIALGVALLGGVMIGTRLPSSPSPAPRALEQPAGKTPDASTGSAHAKPAQKPAADTPFVIKRVLPITGPIKYGEWHWDEAGVPDGPLLVTVDLEARTISVFRSGYEIGAAAVLLGTDDHPTPLGTFPIIAKIRYNVSSIYDAPMPFTMRLTNDGVAIHGAPVEKGYASHGCIGTPDGFAEKLFKVASMGDKVIITRGQMVNVGHDLSGA
jgi:hypothetical protein